MAEILITGIEMPKIINHPLMLSIKADGSVEKIDMLHECFVETEAKAQKISPHGRLGDLDLVEEWMRKKHKDSDCPFDIDAFLFALRKMPTVLEATISND